MSVPVSRLIRYAARRIAVDPRMRAAATKVVSSVADEVKQIARDDDQARAAGQSFRRVIQKLRGGR